MGRTKAQKQTLAATAAKRLAVAALAETQGYSQHPTAVKAREKRQTFLDETGVGLQSKAGLKLQGKENK